MASGKEIRTKIASVKSTQKITKAMEMVAASKLRRTQQRMAASRPYAEKIKTVIGHLSQANPDYRHPYLQTREIKRVGYIVISTDRGLAGGVNINTFREMLKELRQWQGKGVEADLCLVGAKGIAYFRRLKVNVVAATSHLGEVPKVQDLVGAITAMTDAYRQGKIDRLFLVHSVYVNTMSQQPTVSQLLPVEAVDKDNAAAALGLHLRARCGVAARRRARSLHRVAGLSRRRRERGVRDGVEDGRDEGRDRQRRQVHRRPAAPVQQSPPGGDHARDRGNRRRRGGRLI